MTSFLPPDFSTLREAYNWGIEVEIEDGMLRFMADEEPPEGLLDELMAHGEYISYFLVINSPSGAVH